MRTSLQFFWVACVREVEHPEAPTEAQLPAMKKAASYIGQIELEQSLEAAL